jgi:hypothetical protein
MRLLKPSNMDRSLSSSPALFSLFDSNSRVVSLPVELEFAEASFAGE